MFALTGCSGLRLYDSARDNQGEAARKAWSEVDLQASIDGERANLQKLLAAELDTQQRLATSIRDHELAYMVRSSSVGEGLVKPLEARLTTLAGTLELPVVARRNVRSAQRRIANLNENFTLVGLAMPTCAAIAGNQTPDDIAAWLAASSEPLRKAIVRTSLSDLRRECDKPASEADVYATMSGAIGTAWGEFSRSAGELTRRKTEMLGLQRAYDSARAAYDEAVARATSDPQSELNVKAAADRLHHALAALDASSNPFAAKLLAEQRLTAIDEFAQVVAEAQPGKPIPDGASKTATAFIVIPGFFDDARSALAEARKPLALPLLIRRNYERLNLEAAKRDIAVSEAIVRLSHELVESLYRQAEQLANARAMLLQPNVVRLHAKPFFEAFKSSGMADREALYGAAALYLDAVNRLDAQRYQLEYRRIAAYHERSLAYAEVNVKQWESLIGSSVEQVASYSASGFRPEQIANFLNTLGILYIGRGVNK